ncbi:MAG: response regulator [Armatimonadetes bacterium]|jgi:CheY-like chemotaxis protein|nr:response regulator [Armatimonadota bacterium]MDI9585049.1 response regulator [Acidobacteriota bacterium]
MPRVLIVDDDPGVCEVIRAQLALADIDAEIARDGRQALTMLCERTVAQRPYDAMILDLVMPNIDGWQVLKAVKNNPLWSSMKVIVVSGYADSPDDLMKIIEYDGVYVEKRAGFAEDVTQVVERVLED